MDRALLELMRLISPSLPVGGFAYSQGLEAAVENDLIHDEQQARDWISGVLTHSIARLDLPAIHFQYLALEQNDLLTFADFNLAVLAHRETRELRDESMQMGQALLTLLRNTIDQYDNMTDELHDLLFIDAKSLQPDWTSIFSLAAYLSRVNCTNAIYGYAWTWCENQVIAAIKLVPLGQTQGQRILMFLTGKIPALVEQSQQISKDEVGGSLPKLAILSSIHETQYSRLFRS